MIPLRIPYKDLPLLPCTLLLGFAITHQHLPKIKIDFPKLVMLLFSFFCPGTGSFVPRSKYTSTFLFSHLSYDNKRSLLLVRTWPQSSWLFDLLQMRSLMLSHFLSNYTAVISCSTITWRKNTTQEDKNIHILLCFVDSTPKFMCEQTFELLVFLLLTWASLASINLYRKIWMGHCT